MTGTTTTPRTRWTALALAPVATLALLLTACGDSSSGDGSGSGSGAAAATGTTGPTTSPGAGRRGGIDFQKVQQCLDAAGLDVTLPTFDPDERPSGPRPSFDPDSTERPGPPADGDGTRPSGAPADGPGDRTPLNGGPGSAGDPGGAFRELFTDPDVQAALQACGMELPQPPQGTPSPPA